MKTKIATFLMASIFFLTISAFAEYDPTPPKAEPLPDCGCEDPIFDTDSNIIDYTMPPWWIGPAESLPDHM